MGHYRRDSSIGKASRVLRVSEYRLRRAFMKKWLPGRRIGRLAPVDAEGMRRFPNSNLGHACGKVSSLVAFDFEDEAVKPQFVVWRFHDGSTSNLHEFRLGKNLHAEKRTHFDSALAYISPVPHPLVVQLLIQRWIFPGKIKNLRFRIPLHFPKINQYGLSNSSEKNYTKWKSGVFQ
jgi:hypothetical protein